MKYWWILIIVYFCIFIPLISGKQRKKRQQILIMRKRKNKGWETKMKTLAMKLIGKECLVFGIDGLTTQGTILSVTEDNGLEVQTKNGISAVNLDYVTQIEELVEKKKSKKGEV